jgi:hypothetical protein
MIHFSFPNNQIMKEQYFRYQKDDFMYIKIFLRLKSLIFLSLYKYEFD